MIAKKLIALVVMLTLLITIVEAATSIPEFSVNTSNSPLYQNIFKGKFIAFPPFVTQQALYKIWLNWWNTIPHLRGEFISFDEAVIPGETVTKNWTIFNQAFKTVNISVDFFELSNGNITYNVIGEQIYNLTPGRNVIEVGISVDENSASGVLNGKFVLQEI